MLKIASIEPLVSAIWFAPRIPDEPVCLKLKRSALRFINTYRNPSQIKAKGYCNFNVFVSYLVTCIFTRQFSNSYLVQTILTGLTEKLLKTDPVTGIAWISWMSIKSLSPWMNSNSQIFLSNFTGACIIYLMWRSARERIFRVLSRIHGREWPNWTLKSTYFR
jgi:hypothetical protein